MSGANCFYYSFILILINVKVNGQETKIKVILNCSIISTKKQLKQFDLLYLMVITTSTEGTTVDHEMTFAIAFNDKIFLSRSLANPKPDLS